MKNIVIILVAIVLLGGAIYLARPTEEVQERNEERAGNVLGALVAKDQDNYDFGSISMSRGIINYTFRIKNTGPETVVVDKIYTSCMCTTATLLKGGRAWGPYGMPGHGVIPKIGEAVTSGEEADVAIAFDPAAHGPAGVGRVMRSIYLETNDGKLELKFSALVTP
jgi:hypothetical protein